MLSPWKTSCDGWGSDRCACASRAGARWWWWRRRPGAWCGRGRIFQTLARAAPARATGTDAAQGTAGIATPHGHASSRLKLRRPCTSPHGHAPAAARASTPRPKLTMGTMGPEYPAEQDGASYFGTARRERRHRPAAADLLSMPNAGSTKLGSGHGSARRTQRLVAPSPAALQLQMHAFAWSVSSIWRWMPWYSSTDCREKRGQEKINPPSIRQAKQHTSQEHAAFLSSLLLQATNANTSTNNNPTAPHL